MALSDVVLYGESALWLIELEVATSGADKGKVTGIKLETTTPVIHPFGILTEPKFAKPEGEESSSEKKELTLPNGATIQWDSNVRRYDGKTGTLVTGGSSGDSDTITCTVHEAGPASWNLLVSLRGKYVIAVMPYGQDSNGVNMGWVYLLGIGAGPIELSPNDGDVAGLPLQINGKSIAAAATLAGFPCTIPAITVIDSGSLQPPALTETDFADLLAGQIVVKEAA